ncbi:MAG: class I SAM-dependent methyltransferase [Candidatus Hodarchaeota archaeon]
MKKKDCYSYPDENDALTTKFIATKQPFEGYWDKSEKLVLERMKKLIRTYTVNKSNTYFLDAGCGTGRLLPKFESNFDKILAVDPDEDLLQVAKDTAEKFGLLKKVIFQNIPIEKIDLEKESVDVILCSHVLQHVHTEAVGNILAKFEHLLKNYGLVFITTCHSRKDHDFYTKMYHKNHRVIEENIDETEFNSLIHNEKNILPIHFFSRKRIFSVLNSFHFEILDFKSFHILNKIPFVDHIVLRDKLINSISLLQRKLGRDMFIACRRS